MLAKRVSLSFVVSCLLVLSCSHFRDTTAVRFDQQEDVGAVHVAIQSVAPFEGYINSLQPQFAFNTEQALTAAIQQTQTEDSQLFRALMASLTLALPSNTNTKTTTLNADGTTTVTGTESKTPGDASKVVAAPGVPANALGALALPDNKVGIDQSLKFRAAAALLQEVALLNAYVRDAAVSRGARPYVVRMLVTLLPNARLEPYDAYSIISFFQSARGDDNQILRSSAVRSYEDSPDLKEFVGPAMEQARQAKCNAPLEVIPLLVTDNLESSLHSDTVQRIRDMAGAISGFISNAGVGAGVHSRAEDADKTLNQNLNSLFTLARVAPNAVEARLGAVWENGHFVMVPRTFNVTVILLVPTPTTSEIGYDIVPCPTVAFTSTTRMRDAQHGTLLPARPMFIVEPEFALLAANWGLRYDPALRGQYYELMHLAQSGDFVQFETRLAAIPAAAEGRSWATVGGGSRSIWNEFLALSTLTGQSAGTFTVPLNDVRFFDARSRSSVIDDGTTSMVLLNRGANILADRLSAVLRVDGDQTSPPLFLNNTDVAVGLDGRTATLKFPSLHVLLKKKDPLRVFIAVHYERGVREWQSAKYELEWYPTHEEPPAFVRRNVQQIGEHDLEDPIPYVFIGEDEKKDDEIDPGYTMTIPTRSIRASRDGVGALSIELRRKEKDKPQEVHVNVSGGFISAIDPPVPLDGPELILPDGVHVLTLRNLVGGTKLSVHTFRFEGKKKIAVDGDVDVIGR